MTTTTFNVPGISCDHCKTAIEAAVGRQPGVARVEVDVEAKSVKVSHDLGVGDVASVVAVIEDQGYDVASYEEAGV